MVELGRAVAVVMATAPGRAPLLASLPTTTGWPPTIGSTPYAPTCWRWPATKGARAGYLAAARRTTSLPEQRYLEARAARLAGYRRA